MPRIRSLHGSCGSRRTYARSFFTRRARNVRLPPFCCGGVFKKRGELRMLSRRVLHERLRQHRVSFIGCDLDVRNAYSCPPFEFMLEDFSTEINEEDMADSGIPWSYDVIGQTRGKTSPNSPPTGDNSATRCARPRSTNGHWQIRARPLPSRQCERG